LHGLIYPELIRKDVWEAFSGLINHNLQIIQILQSGNS